ADGGATVTVTGVGTAGQTPQLPVGAGQATRIMAGAPIPSGADAVVQVEHTKPPEGNRIQIDDKPLRPGLNILRQGTEMRPGDVVLKPGAVLRPQGVGLLATRGWTAIRVHPPPRVAGVALVSTGDELVEASQQPGAGQIRNGNGPMLLAQVCRAGGVPRYLGIARDDVAHLRSLIAEGLRSNVLVLSGGVSAGKLDLVPGVLAELGVAAHFHKVEMKPGKPVFFGTRGQALVFGLPGNPVSSMACFELFVRPALRRLRGYADARPHVVQAVLAEDYPYRTDRPTYHPAWLSEDTDGWRVRIPPWVGSPHLPPPPPAARVPPPATGGP